MPLTNVLLIEDNLADARLTSMMLGGAFRLETRDRLAPGLRRLAQGGIDVLLLDLSLPDSQGIETFERAHAAHPAVPIVVMSGLNDEDAAIQAAQNGAQDYLIKGRVDGFSLGHALTFAVERQKQHVAVKEPGKILVFVGVRGGVGTTTVALNIASGMAEQKRSVIATEVRSTVGTFSSYLGRVPATNISDLLAMPPERISVAQVRSHLNEYPSGLNILFGPQENRESVQMGADQIGALLDNLANMADFVVVDLPDVHSSCSKAVVRHSKIGGLVLGNDPVSVACGRRILDELQSAGLSRPMLRAIVVNRSAANNGLRVDEITEQLGVAALGVLTPAADLCLSAERAGALFSQMHRDSLPAQIVSDMVKKLLSPGLEIARS